MNTQFVERETDKYRVRSTGRGSDQLGPCEVCHKPTPEVFILNHQMRYEGGWTYYGAKGHVFRHRECLERIVAE
jgi:hypothetical protein